MKKSVIRLRTMGTSEKDGPFLFSFFDFCKKCFETGLQKMKLTKKIVFYEHGNIALLFLKGDSDEVINQSRRK